jgi:Ca2+-binding EF-hand superfamily protein
MELAIAAAVIVVVIALLVFKNSTVKGLEVLDVNQDGKIDRADVTEAVANVTQDVKRRATGAKAQVKKAVARVTKKRLSK